jgi:hypothetical protein
MDDGEDDGEDDDDGDRAFGDDDADEAATSVAEDTVVSQRYADKSRAAVDPVRTTAFAAATPRVVGSPRVVAPRVVAGSSREEAAIGMSSARARFERVRLAAEENAKQTITAMANAKNAAAAAAATAAASGVASAAAAGGVAAGRSNPAAASAAASVADSVAASNVNKRPHSALGGAAPLATTRPAIVGVVRMPPRVVGVVRRPTVAAAAAADFAAEAKRLRVAATVRDVDEGDGGGGGGGGGSGGDDDDDESVHPLFR